jgi:hypothetical protein
MLRRDVKIAIFSDRYEVELAVKKLAAAGFDFADVSIVGKGYQSDEKIVGFHSAGGRMTFWGKRGEFWGELWDLFAGGVSMTIPAVGCVIVLGYLADVVVAAVEGSTLFGGMSAWGAALYGLGTPRQSVLEYEQAVKSDGFLVMARGTNDELARAKRALETVHPLLLVRHRGAKVPDALTTALA